MKKKKEIIKPIIDYKNALIAVLIIELVFTAGQIGSSIPLIIAIGNKTYAAVFGYFVLIILYIDCLLAIIVGSILGFKYSLRSIANSQKKAFGYVTLGTTIASLVAIIIPVIILLVKLLPR